MTRAVSMGLYEEDAWRSKRSGRASLRASLHKTFARLVVLVLILRDGNSVVDLWQNGCHGERLLLSLALLALLAPAQKLAQVSTRS